MKERPILFSGPMVRAILNGRKTQTRRVIKMNRLVQPRKMVQGDAPFASHYCADPRWVYDGAINQHGAVSAKVATGDDGLLGLKPGEFDFICPYADGETVLVSGEGWRIIPAPGQRLWVREAWFAGACADGIKPADLHQGTWLKDNGGLWYQADDAVPKRPISPKGKYRHSRFMPRWASRITLEVTKVRVELLNKISVADAVAEGMQTVPEYEGGKLVEDSVFRIRWDALNGKPRRYKTKIGKANATRVADFSWAANPWVWVIEFKRVQP